MTKMAIREASSKLFIVLIILIKLSSGEQNVNKPAESRRHLTKRHHEKDFSPRLTHQPHNVKVKPREPHSIECPVESQPESEVKWFKDGQVLTSEPAHLEQTGSELMFFQINEEDTGDYHCEAENPLGRVASERFRLTVQSSTTQDDSILIEPRVYLAVDLQEWPAEFRCTIPVSLLARSNKLWQTSRADQFVKWHRNDRPLSVSWVGQREVDANAKTDQFGRSFRARQNEMSPNEFVLSITRPNRQLDNNSTFTCLLKWDEEVARAEESYESRPALLRFEPPKQPIKLDIPMGQPIDITGSPSLSSSSSPNDNSKNVLTMQTLDPERNRASGENHTTQLTGDDLNKQSPAGRIRTSLADTLSDLYQIAKPALILFGVMCLVAVIVLLQFLFVRRRAQAHRYMKHHHQYSSSASSANSALCGPGGGGSGGSGASSAHGDCDPVFSSLLARTLSAPSAGSLSGANKKYKYYRDHMRGKVAAAITSDHQFVDGAHHDFIDAAAYFAATHQQQQDCQAPMFMPNNNNNNNSAVPNLYNQSLAAREQARSLLQSGEHVRSMGNLASSGQLQRLEHPLSKQHEMIMSGTQRAGQQHHLELPMNFANSYNTGASGPIESGAASLLQHQSMAASQQQQLWNSQHHLLLATAQQHQQQQHKQHNANEQYQLVSCLSISPSSTSSIVAGSNSSSGTAVAGGQQQEETTASQFSRQASRANVPPVTRDSISNHYSIIENQDDEHEDGVEDERYEELDDREFKRSSTRSSGTSSSADYRKPTSTSENTRDFNRKTTFGLEVSNNNNKDRGQQKSSGHHLRSSIVSNGSSSSSSSSTGGRLASTFGSKRASSKAKQRKVNQEQLSPYAVSSICHNQQQPPPPPVSSEEAMRALKEQFDINQLVMIDNSHQPSGLSGQQVDGAPPLPFNLPPPPPPPPGGETKSASETAVDRSMRPSKSKRARQKGQQDD